MVHLPHNILLLPVNPDIPEPVILHKQLRLHV